MSANGIHWLRGTNVAETDAKGQSAQPGMVLTPSTNWWTFDTHHVSVGSVVMMSSEKVRASSGVLWMYYDGGDNEEMEVPEQLAGYLARSGGNR